MRALINLPISLNLHFIQPGTFYGIIFPVLSAMLMQNNPLARRELKKK
jgi:hypothetical protein